MLAPCPPIIIALLRACENKINHETHSRLEKKLKVEIGMAEDTGQFFGYNLRSFNGEHEYSSGPGIITNKQITIFSHND